MKTTSLDILESASLPAEQAKAILQVMELELDARDAHVATRADVLASAADVKAEFAGLKAEFAGLKGEFTGLKAEFGGLKAEIGGLKAEFGLLRAGLDKQIQDRVDAAAGKLSRWIVQCLLVQTSAGAVIYEAISYFQHR